MTVLLRYHDSNFKRHTAGDTELNQDIIMSNPLLENHRLPPFSAIKAEHVEPAIDHALSTARNKIDTILSTLSEPTWETLVHPMEEMDALIDSVWSPVSHMNSVVNSEELRQAYNACLPKLSEFSTELGQNETLYQAYKAIAEGTEYQKLDTAQKKVIDNAVRDFRLSGVELDQAKRDEFKKLSQQMTERTAKFEENLLDATHAWRKLITDESLLSGLPPSTIEMAEQMAKREGEEGWLFTLDFPSYMPVMSYADNRELREEMYTAFATKASDQGPHAGKWDNTQVMLDILNLRHQLANLLGFANHAERSLATKMAQSPQQVLDFLQDLAKRSKPIAENEYAELRAFAKVTADQGQLEAWDVTYFAEKLRQQRYSISQEELKPYFPEDKVVSGLFAW
ncbi:Oligopeptidase A [Methylophaga muralis]|uniref:Oligopeptidase A n=1 Tax=Methylophaga muralis TaxID=291169 RepID=A0A1E3GRY0_9GAMM|nr:Oligopeptidase A [Methylophaga muralis]